MDAVSLLRGIVDAWGDYYQTEDDRMNALQTHIDMAVEYLGGHRSGDGCPTRDQVYGALAQLSCALVIHDPEATWGAVRASLGLDPDVER